MPSFYQKLTQGVLIAGCIIAATPPVWATSFTISSGETVTAAQTLLDGETGLIESGGFLNTTTTSITSGANNTVITNNGTISVNVDSVTVFSNGSTIINNGLIKTSGSDSVVTDFRGSGHNFTNNGTIVTTGVGAEVFFNRADNNVYNNNGLIQTSGLNADVFEWTGENTTINNSGRIAAVGSATQAINGSENADTLNLLSGSQIIGIIDLDGGTDIVNISGANNSSTLTLTDVETINLINGNGLLVGDVATVVDPTGQSVSSAVLGTTTFAVHNVVNQRLAHNEVLKPIQVATSELTSGMVFQERAPQIWGSALGEMRERDLEGIALGYDHNYVGFTGGYEASFYKARIGLLGGFVRSTVKTTGDKFGRVRSVDTDTDSFFVGAYGQYFLGGINLTTTLMAGYEDHENDRAVVDNLNGFETAQADFSSFFISPSLTVSSAYNVGTQVELRPSVTFAYSGGWYDDYAESGTTRSDLVIDDRNVHALTGQLQLAAAYSLAEENELEFRAGAKARYTDNDDIDVTLAGTDFRIPHASDDSVYGGYVGVNIRVAIKEKINLVADVEHGRAGGGEEHIAAMLKLEAVF